MDSAAGTELAGKETIRRSIVIRSCRGGDGRGGGDVGRCPELATLLRSSRGSGEYKR